MPNKHDPIDFLVAGESCSVSPASAHFLEIVSGPEWHWTRMRSGQNLVPYARRSDNKCVMLARVVAQAADNEEIGYRNGNPFDLTDQNLVVTRQDRRMRRSLKLW